MESGNNWTLFPLLRINILSLTVANNGFSLTDDSTLVTVIGGGFLNSFLTLTLLLSDLDLPCSAAIGCVSKFSFISVLEV